jgi:hypothetical protein
MLQQRHFSVPALLCPHAMHTNSRHQPRPACPRVWRDAAHAPPTAQRTPRHAQTHVATACRLCARWCASTGAHQRPRRGCRRSRCVWAARQGMSGTRARGAMVCALDCSQPHTHMHTPPAHTHARTHAPLAACVAEHLPLQALALRRLRRAHGGGRGGGGAAALSARRACARAGAGAGVCVCVVCACARARQCAGAGACVQRAATPPPPKKKIPHPKLSPAPLTAGPSSSSAA